jgi:small subunit ribosomal protein S20
MAHSKSALKRIRQNEKRRLQNRSRRTRVRNVCKTVEKALASGQPDEARVLLPGALKILDQAVGWGILHKNTAARKKSRLSHNLAKLTAESGA